MSKKSLEQQINEFLEDWHYDQMNAFIGDILPLIKLYDVDEDDDWVMKEVGKEDERNVRLIQTVYLISRIADLHGPKFATIACRYKGLWQKMQDIVKPEEKCN